MAFIEKSSNPAFSSKLFDKQGFAAEGQRMTVQGTVNKSLILFVCTIIPAYYVFDMFLAGSGTTSFLLIGGIGGFVAALVTIFKPTVAPISAPIYAALEGLFLGGVSALAESMYPGIAFQAVILTFGTMFVMLFAYRSGLIKVTEKLRSGIIAATGAIFVVYMINFVMSMFGSSMPMMHEGGLMGIGFSLLVIGIAAMNLLLDFDFIEKNARQGTPKYMEWFSAFGLMVTLVWLYLEILRLLMKLNRD